MRGLYLTALCDNGTWTIPFDNLVGVDVCVAWWGSAMGQDFGCTTDAGVRPITIGVKPRHGKTPLTVSINHRRGFNGRMCGYTIDWGDGARDVDPPHACFDVPENRLLITTHTYTSLGSYSIRHTDVQAPQALAATANIRVDPATTASIQNSSQLASALSALESALKAFLNLLGQ